MTDLPLDPHHQVDTEVVVDPAGQTESVADHSIILPESGRWKRIVIAGPHLTDSHVAHVINATAGGILPPDTRIWVES